jgi:hypothetical protein
MAKRPIQKRDDKRVEKTKGEGMDAPWAASVNMYVTGSSAVDEMDLVALAMERKWGVDRLRLLVSAELREKFDRQRYLVNQAIWHGELEELRVQTKRMMAAYRVLDREADQAGKLPLSMLTEAQVPVMEASLRDGRVLMIVADEHALTLAGRLQDDRHAVVWSVSEVARMIETDAWISAVKLTFPGAEVKGVRVPARVTDPLDRVRDTQGRLDDPLPF